MADIPNPPDFYHGISQGGKDGCLRESTAIRVANTKIE